jgi:hypothetical protein
MIENIQSKFYCTSKLPPHWTAISANWIKFSHSHPDSLVLDSCYFLLYVDSSLTCLKGFVPYNMVFHFAIAFLPNSSWINYHKDPNLCGTKSTSLYKTCSLYYGLQLCYRNFNPKLHESVTNEFQTRHPATIQFSELSKNSVMCPAWQTNFSQPFSPIFTQQQTKLTLSKLFLRYSSIILV